jgi:hypothetical protein
MVCVPRLELLSERLARDRSPADLADLVPAVVATSPAPGARAAAAYQSPIAWLPPLTYRGMRRLAAGVLPGARFRRHLCWRYSLV